MRTSSTLGRAKMARDALDLLTRSLPDVAAELGVSIYTLRDWRLLRRAPSPEAATKLATLLNWRAKSMQKMAKSLTAMARKREREGGVR